MGGAKRYPSPCAPALMGIASLHPSYNRRTFAISRRIAPEVLHLVCPSSRAEGAGKTGCTLHPRSRVQYALESAHTSIQVQSEHSGLPRAMVLRLIARSPW